MTSVPHLQTERWTKDSGIPREARASLSVLNDFPVCHSSELPGGTSSASAVLTVKSPQQGQLPAMKNFTRSPEAALRTERGGLRSNADSFPAGTMRLPHPSRLAGYEESFRRPC